MEETEVKNVLEAALMVARKPLPMAKLLELFAKRAPEVDRAVIRDGLAALSQDYEGRGLEIKEVASGFRVQVKGSMAAWLQPLWEERAPRYTRALLETLALVAYRQPVTRGEIEEVRGVTVSPNIIRTLLERGWIRVVGHRDVPGRPEMLGTTKEFLDYFGLKSLTDLPELSEIQEGLPELSPQTDLIESLQASVADGADMEASPEPVAVIDSKLVPTGPGDDEPAEERQRGEHQGASANDPTVSGATDSPDGDRDTASEPI